jgi:glutamate/tyrosine decarboxylase-like PLP-dependent enzyme
VDELFQLDTLALRAAIAADRAAGARPFLVAASAGTVNTGTVDPLDEIADIAAEHGLWFHVDGAYGALGVLAPDATPAFVGMELADSLALDPHKWLGVPVDCGAALFARPEQARDAFSLVPAYLRDEGTGELGWYAEYGPEQTRPFRALRTWATLSHLGRAGVVRLVTRTTALAQRLAAMIDEARDFELLTPVVTSIVAFRYRPIGIPDRLDDLNRTIPAAVQRAGRAFLTGTKLGEVEALRACVLNPATTEADLNILLEEIRAAAERLLHADPS